MVVTINKDAIWDLLKQIPDPEIPVINIVELGIARDVEFVDDKIIISITPTYSGCPAMKAIEKDIVQLFSEKGFQKVELKMVYAPAWTTDWLSDEAKMKLRAYGISPPEKSSINKSVLMGRTIHCPRCNSVNAEMISAFGSTACKALYRCMDCKEPFDYFKCH